MNPASSARASRSDSEGRRLEAALLDWVAGAPAGFVRDGTSRAARYGLDAQPALAVEKQFERLALDLFAYQYERIPVYRAYADRLGRSPARVRQSVEVPPLPVEAFKRARIATFGAATECAAFHTSGTSGDTAGVLHLESLDLYDLALERSFRHHVIPDTERIRMLLLVPPTREAPHSSLAYMLERVCRRWGTPGSATFVHDDVVEWPALRVALLESVAAEEPVCILGTAFAWVHVLERCARDGFEVTLAPGSRGFETGGFKGRSRVLARSELDAGLERHFALPATHVVSEYGMTEMGSQHYTLRLRHALLGEPPGDTAWSYPAWLRPRLVDSESGRCLDLDQADEVGLLAHHDLANRGSLANLLTADLGRPLDCSFELLGRCPRADRRGCGLTSEEWRTASAPESDMP
jgi:hypothetical protein